MILILPFAINPTNHFLKNRAQPKNNNQNTTEVVHPNNFAQAKAVKLSNNKLKPYEIVSRYSVRPLTTQKPNIC